MSYQQLIGFNQRKATTQKGYCLRNVRTGFGIGPKYYSAWDSWINSTRRTSPIPDGVDVPIYFSWGRYGHIGVRLADGRFWSDGKIYSSLWAYRVTHPAVRYKGWSEEVNDISVIRYVTPKPQPSNTNNKYTVARGDTLSKIAKKYGVTWQSIYQLNRNLIRDPNSISVGWVLNIPPKQGVIYYTVQRGDTLSKIAQQYSNDWRTIYDWNRGVIGSNPNVIKAGQRLRVR